MKEDKDRWLRDEILARMGFCNNMLNVAIVLAGFVLAGFSGLAGSNLPKSVTIGFLLLSSLAFQTLNMILSEEELKIVEMNRRVTVTIAVSNPNVLWNGRFLFLFLFGILILIFTGIYYRGILGEYYKLSRDAVTAGSP